MAGQKDSKGSKLGTPWFLPSRSRSTIRHLGRPETRLGSRLVHDVRGHRVAALGEEERRIRLLRWKAHPGRAARRRGLGTRRVGGSGWAAARFGIGGGRLGGGVHRGGERNAKGMAIEMCLN